MYVHADILKAIWAVHFVHWQQWWTAPLPHLLAVVYKLMLSSNQSMAHWQ